MEMMAIRKSITMDKHEFAALCETGAQASFLNATIEAASEKDSEASVVKAAVEIEAGAGLIDQLLKTEAAIHPVDGDTVRRGDFETVCCPSRVWREKVVQWCYDVADHFGEKRSLVSVAMKILDRFCAMQSQTSNMDERKYELASMSSLFLALRISGSRSLGLQELRSMSREGVNVNEIVRMVTLMVRMLKWNHGIVTPMEFITALVDMLPRSLDERQKQEIQEIACYQVEISIFDVVLSHCKPSEVATAALLNSCRAHISNYEARLAKTLAQTCLSSSSNDLVAICARLDGIYRQSADGDMHTKLPHLVVESDDDCYKGPLFSGTRGLLTSRSTTLPVPDDDENEDDDDKHGRADGEFRQVKRCRSQNGFVDDDASKRAKSQYPAAQTETDA